MRKGFQDRSDHGPKAKQPRSSYTPSFPPPFPFSPFHPLPPDLGLVTLILEHFADDLQHGRDARPARDHPHLGYLRRPGAGGAG